MFLALVDGVAGERWDELPGLYAEHTHVTHPFHPGRPPALRTRAELAEHFRPGGEPRPRRQVTDVVIHETTDPEVIVAEFAYVGEGFRRPGIFVLRVRDGLIVESRDYFEHRETFPAGPVERREVRS